MTSAELRQAAERLSRWFAGDESGYPLLHDENAWNAQREIDRKDEDMEVLARAYLSLFPADDGDFAVCPTCGQPYNKQPSLGGHHDEVRMLRDHNLP